MTDIDKREKWLRTTLDKNHTKQKMIIAFRSLRAYQNGECLLNGSEMFGGLFLRCIGWRAGELSPETGDVANSNRVPSTKSFYRKRNERNAVGVAGVKGASHLPVP